LLDSLLQEKILCEKVVFLKDALIVVAIFEPWKPYRDYIWHLLAARLE